MARRPKQARAKADVHPLRRWFFRIVKLGLLLALFVAIALAAMVAVARSELPSFADLKSSPNGQMVRVRAADGTIIQSLGPSYGRWLPYAEIPQVMKDAMISVEDRRYESHFGVDPIGVARSLKVRLDRGYWAQGGSTITQQLARNIFLNNSKDFGRKAREMLLATAMETKFSKEQILELYLNKVYFGGGAYGIDAASRKFFDHGAETLELPEAAVIAGLVKAPSRYSPTADAEAAIGRAGVVLQTMQANGYVSAAEAAAVDVKAVKLAPEPPQDSVRYFTDWALPQLDLLIEERVEPIDVWTTLDLSMQRTATGAIQAGVPAGTQGALVAIDRGGAVRAMVGGTDYVRSNYNRAVTALRQPGSAWKLFVYLAALEAGYTPDDVVTDAPIEIDGWAPRNSSGRFAGDVDVRTAFAYSINTVAAQIGNELGFSTVASMARRFGITTPVNTQPSMVLGTSEVRLIDLTRAFAAVAARGRDVEPYGIAKVTTADGDLLYRREEAEGSPLVDDAVAAQMIDLLQTAVNTGTGRAAQIGRPSAGKTGTTSSNKDGWFVGFSSGLTTGVWMGRDDAKAVRGLQGGTAPANAWARFMRVAVAKRPVEAFDTEVTLPEFATEEGEAWFGAPGEGEFQDENGMPLESDDLGIDPLPDSIQQPELDENFIERATGGRRPAEAPRRDPPARAPVQPPREEEPAPPF